MKEPIPQEIIEDETPSWDEQERKSYQEMHEASMKPKHTPGPWEIGCYTNYKGFGIWGKGVGCIAERWYDQEQLEPYGAQIMANARLIAAAPEMLRALQKIASTQNHLTLTCGNGGPTNPECVRCIAIDAIAKATGGDK